MKTSSGANNKFLHHPPSTWEEDVSQLYQTTFFLVSTIGPAVFVLKTDDNRTYKVYIGEKQRCTCGGGEARGKLCLHILFVMLKVLRVPQTNHLAWQLNLSDGEVNKLLSREHLRCETQEQHQQPFMKKGRGSMCHRRCSANRKTADEDTNDDAQQSGSTPKRRRKDLSEDPTCSICQEIMTEEEGVTSSGSSSSLCFCEVGCGSNFHTRCVRLYGAYARSERKALQCPMCRAPWKVLPGSSSVETKTKSTKISMPPVRCQRCQIKIRSKFYRCARCCGGGNAGYHYDLCQRCFEGGAARDHQNEAQKKKKTASPYATIEEEKQHHPFVKADVSEYPPNWSPAIIPHQPVLPSSNSQLLQMQNRELSNADYQLLLSLDQNNTPTLHNHLLKAFPKVTSSLNQERMCLVCETSFFNTDSDKSSIRQLPCPAQHWVHESCALNLLIEAQHSNQGMMPSCQKCGSHALLFPALRRESTRRRQEVNNVKEENKSNTKKLTLQAKCKSENEKTSRTLTSLFEGCVVGSSSLSTATKKEIFREKKYAVRSGRMINKPSLVRLKTTATSQQTVPLSVESNQASNKAHAHQTYRVQGKTRSVVKSKPYKALSLSHESKQSLDSGVCLSAVKLGGLLGKNEAKRVGALKRGDIRKS